MRRKLTVDYKVVARTAPELHEEFSILVLKLGAAGVKFRKREIGVEGAINALLMMFFDLSPAERAEAIRAHIARFQQVMESEDRLEIGGPDWPDPPEITAKVRGKRPPREESA